MYVPRTVIARGALLLALAIPATASADSAPFRCEAVFMGPAKDCGLDGAWTVTGTGRNEAQARKNAESRLEELIEAAVELRASKAAGTIAMATVEIERKQCPSAAEAETKFYCHAEPSLAEDQLCFAALNDSSCYSGYSLDMQGVGWKMLETGHDQLCSAVRTEQQRSKASDAQQLRCEVTCLREARLRCAG